VRGSLMPCAWRCTHTASHTLSFVSLIDRPVSTCADENVQRHLKLVQKQVGVIALR
jgi:hypothetical protein